MIFCDGEVKGRWRRSRFPPVWRNPAPLDRVEQGSQGLLPASCLGCLYLPVDGLFAQDQDERECARMGPGCTDAGTRYHSVVELT